MTTQQDQFPASKVFLTELLQLYLQGREDDMLRIATVLNVAG